ncbi:MAG: hypothetical protein Q4E16_04590 [Neisseria sp.]|nr:hypothetical protein [Neisseria sp.]
MRKQTAVCPAVLGGRAIAKQSACIAYRVLSVSFSGRLLSAQSRLRFNAPAVLACLPSAMAVIHACNPLILRF